MSYRISQSNSGKDGHDSKTIVAIVAMTATAVGAIMVMAKVATTAMAIVAIVAIMAMAIAAIVATELTMATTEHVIEYIVYKKMTSNTTSYSAVAILNFPNLTGYYIPMCLQLCTSISITNSV